MDKRDQLYAIDAPHYYAGLIVDQGIVREAAPILGWTVGRPWSEISKYFKNKGYKIHGY